MKFLQGNIEFFEEFVGWAALGMRGEELVQRKTAFYQIANQWFTIGYAMNNPTEMSVIEEPGNHRALRARMRRIEEMTT